ncbi:Neurogenic protein big brain [Eumeta japonica]|uniref:Neurogenic protein big brain n=1 Tax=Eumeta variegata TaxID=151549 RepID=A0A4C1WDF9_EUMVA|nr:Neurogenic protein big brain [Eumeta japonica]
MYAADEERTEMREQERNLESHIVTLIEKLEHVLHEGSAGDGGAGAALESARAEVRRSALWAAASAECAAAFAYALAVGGAAGGAGVGASAAAVVLASALAAGCAVAALTLCFERVSVDGYLPPIAVTQENVQAVDILIRENRRIIYVELMRGLGIESAAMQRIIRDRLSLRKRGSRWMPRKLADEQKARRVDWRRFLIDKFDDGANKKTYTII